MQNKPKKNRMEEKNKYAKLAKEFFATKSRKAYFAISAFSKDHLEEYDFYQEFSDKELQVLRTLRDKYGKDEFVKHLDEFIVDDCEYSDLAGEDEILNIDLDFKFYKYEFGRHELQGDKLTRYSALVEMSDQSYISLLALCLEDQSMNINKLKYADETLYSMIMRGVDAYYFDDDHAYYAMHPYLVTMDELFADVEQILSNHPELRQDNSCCFRGYIC